MSNRMRRREVVRHGGGRVAQPDGWLGDFGTPKPETVRTFGYLGERFRLNPGLSELAFVDFMEEAQAVDEKSPEAITIIKRLMREFIHPDDFDTWWAHARAQRQNSEDLLVLVHKLTEAAVGRPTGRRPGSSNGPGPTATKSTASSSDKVLRQLDGRPDLQAVIVRKRRDQLAA